MFSFSAASLHFGTDTNKLSKSHMAHQRALRLAEDTDEQTLYPSIALFMESHSIFDTVETMR